MSNNIDALVYAQMDCGIDPDPTKITADQKSYIKQLAGTTSKDWRNVPEFANLNVVNENYTNAIDSMNDILKNTTIKRALCYKTTTGPQKVGVRLPTPSLDSVAAGSDDNSGATNGSGDIIKDYSTTYGYIDKLVPVPASIYADIKDPYDTTKMLAGRYFRNSPACNLFYKVYCNAIKQDYKKLTIGTSDNDDGFFSQFKNECACYGDKPPQIQSIAPNIPNVCVLPGCDESTAYLDEKSKDSSNKQKPCTQKICENIININKNDIGHNMYNKISAKCIQSPGGASGIAKWVYWLFGSMGGVFVSISSVISCVLIVIAIIMVVKSKK